MNRPSPTSRSTPELSVVLVVGDRRRRAAHALRSLLTQDALDRMEILVVDLGRPPEGEPLDGTSHPAVRTVALPPGTTLGPARSHAVIRARAPVVAFLEEHARACPGWAAALLRSHTEEWAGVGPVVESANPGIGKSDLVGLITYGYFRPPKPAGRPTKLLPGHNSSFRRSVLLSYGEELGRLLMNDNLLFARLVRDGHRLAYAAGARILHFDEATVRDCMTGYFHYHRIYGHRRAALFGWSRLRRFVYVVLTPIIPLYFFWNFDRYLRHRLPEARKLLARHAVAAYLCQLAGAWGQALGLVAGPGASEHRFTRYELESERPGGEDA